MSGLRHVADTYLQEINSEPVQDFSSDINDTTSDFEGSKPRKNHISDPSFIHTRMLLESQFDAAQQKLIAHQKQSLKVLQQFCIEVVGNQASPHPTAALAWSDQPMTLPGSLLQSPTKFMQRPCTPAEFAPAMPEILDTEVLSPEQENLALIAQPDENERGTPSFTKMWSCDQTGLEEAVKPTMGKMLSCTQTWDLQEGSANRITQTSELQREDAKERQSVFNFLQFRAKRKATFQAQSIAKQSIDSDKKNGSTPAQQNRVLNKAVFADVAAMKAKVKENIMKPEYNVAQFYKTEGLPQQIARSINFDNVTLGVIGLNALWIWIETDYNDASTLLDASALILFGENFFCLYFTGELLIRFLAFKFKRDCLRDAWFVFDSALVLMMVLETWIFTLVIWVFGVDTDADLGNASILRTVRLLRLTRMARLARLLRAMPELMILLKGISVAARSVFFTLVLLVVILYVFAIAFRQLCSDSELEQSHFKTVPEAMNTLLLKGVLPDQGGLVTEVGDVNYFFGAIVILFVLLSSLTIINMLVGVLCEVVSVVSSVEKEQMMLNFVKSKLLSLLQESGIGREGNLTNLCISRDDFEALLLLPEGARVIQEVGVDVVVLVDLLDDIFTEEAALSFADVMELVLQLRGSNTATVKDVVDLRKFLTQLATDSHDHLFENMTKMVAHTVNQIVHHQFEIAGKAAITR